MMTGEEALKRLKRGNQLYLNAATNPGNISLPIRKKTFDVGQSPYAVVIACADSREIPEAIFSAGIGELFVIRVAGNVIMESQLASIEYAVAHLGCSLVLVLGHEKCGAIEAAIAGEDEGYIHYLADEINAAIGDETDETKASCMNVRKSVAKIQESLGQKLPQMQVTGAYYQIHDGKVEFELKGI